MSTSVTPLPVNTHIHSPWSFSAFDSMDQAVQLAAEQDVAALGLSDFNTMEGFDEFYECCRARQVFPLYNIEFIALHDEDRQQGIRWNDPANPGVIYFCGKALSYPLTLGIDSRNALKNLWKGSQDHIWKVIKRVNEHLAACDIPLSLEYTEIRSRLARNTVRERHVARALCDAITAGWADPAERTVLFRRLFDDHDFTVEGRDPATLQGEIRSRLLKSGKPAFVPEEPDAFLPLDQVTRIILDGGGIPCYPVLSDDSRPLNEREADPARLADTLAAMNIYAVEFIPLRNTLSHLEKVAAVFAERGFCITFGTEHNTPALVPMVPQARNGEPLSPRLQTLAWRGASILAAHQDARRKGRPGFVDEEGLPAARGSDLEELVALGNRLIRQQVPMNR